MNIFIATNASNANAKRIAEKCHSHRLVEFDCCASPDSSNSSSRPSHLYVIGKLSISVWNVNDAKFVDASFVREMHKFHSDVHGLILGDEMHAYTFIRSCGPLFGSLSGDRPYHLQDVIHNIAFSSRIRTSRHDWPHFYIHFVAHAQFTILHLIQSNWR